MLVIKMAVYETLSEYSVHSCISLAEIHSTLSLGSGQSNHTNYDPYTMKCDYCPNTHRADLIKCISSDCNRYFCYNRLVSGTRTSHIISHLKTASHNSIEIYSEISESFHRPSCSGCKTSNIFSLGYIFHTKKIICRVPCLLSESTPDQFTFDPLVNEYGLNNLLFARIRVNNNRNIQNNRVVYPKNKQSKITLREIREIEFGINDIYLDPEEFMDQSSMISKIYDSKEQYASVFNYLLTLECFEENIQKSKLVYNQVNLYFGGENCLKKDESKLLIKTLNNQGSRTKAMFFGYEIGCRFTDKDDILVKDQSGWNSYAKIIGKNAGWFILEFYAPIPNNTRTVDMTARSENNTCIRLKNCLKKFEQMDIDEALEGAILGYHVETKLDFEIYIDDYTFRGFFKLNDSQINAIKNSLTHRVSIIHGPPGTGKTETIVALIAHIESLCRAYTNI